jgi:hypothetical protein
LSAAPSALEAAFEHAADAVPLGEEVEDEHGQRHEHRPGRVAGHHQAEQQLAATTVPATMTLVVT